MPTSKKLLDEWYGYSKRVDTGNEYGFTFIDNLPTKVRLFFGDDYDLVRNYSGQYYPECDGLTDDDFIEWVKNTPNLLGGYIKNWRSRGIINRLVKDLGLGSHDYAGLYRVTDLITSFYVTDKPRNDRIFRVIELNEFLSRGKPTQTLEDFLLTDTEYVEKCKKQIITKTSHLDEILNQDLPDFLKFGTKTSTKARQLLLPLTLEEMKKVLDFEKNPLNHSNPQGSHTADFAEAFIKAAFGSGTEQVVIHELDHKQVHNAIAAAFLSSGSLSFWNAVSASKASPAEIMELASEEILKMNSAQASFTREFAYIVSTDALSKLDPDEVLAVAHGYDKPHRWAASHKGKGPLTIVTELIHSKKVDAVVILKLIAYTVINNDKLIKIEEDFNWELINEVPAMWTYATLTSKASCKLTLSPALRGMNRS